MVVVRYVLPAILIATGIVLIVIEPSVVGLHGLAMAIGAALALLLLRRPRAAAHEHHRFAPAPAPAGD